MRPFFDSDEKHPRCPYCDAAKRWHARLDTHCIEGGKTTDAPRRKLVKTLEKEARSVCGDRVKSDRRQRVLRLARHLAHLARSQRSGVAAVCHESVAGTKRAEAELGRNLRRLAFDAPVGASGRRLGARRNEAFYRLRFITRVCWSNTWSAGRTSMVDARWKDA